MSLPRDGDEGHAAEAFVLENEQAEKGSGPQHSYEYSGYGDEEESLLGEDTEDARAILLQNLGEANGSRTTLKSKEYDPSDDSAAAMVHRVRVSLSIGAQT